ncbi:MULTISPECIES: GIY-YIG nuclease family protein [unclassified Brevundimonas]|uniref:GIY-YIG nuclease family protein n=1 Tax=unclassified Brevundimonas TaxID=2622653 RepID=UPI003F8F4FCA
MVSRDGLIGVYMMANRMHGVIYIGVTSDLIMRTDQHRRGVVEGFTRRYGLKRLVWYERHGTIVDAIQREKSLKRYPRDWKTNLIERMNPDWSDLFPALMSGGAETAPDIEGYRDWTPAEPAAPKPRLLPKNWRTDEG